jgi:hypothetical protein
MSDLTVPPLPTFYYWTPKPGSGISSHLATWSSNTGPHPQWDVGEWVRKADAEAALASLQARLEAATETLRDLHAMVRGECPSLLNEDSGGNADLAIRIEEILDAATQEGKG